MLHFQKEHGVFSMSNLCINSLSNTPESCFNLEKIAISPIKEELSSTITQTPASVSEILTEAFKILEAELENVPSLVEKLPFSKEDVDILLSSLPKLSPEKGSKVLKLLDKSPEELPSCERLGDIDKLFDCLRLDEVYYEKRVLSPELEKAVLSLINDKSFDHIVAESDKYIQWSSEGRLELVLKLFKTHPKLISDIVYDICKQEKSEFFLQLSLSLFKRKEFSTSQMLEFFSSDILLYLKKQDIFRLCCILLESNSSMFQDLQASQLIPGKYLLRILEKDFSLNKETFSQNLHHYPLHLLPETDVEELAQLLIRSDNFHIQDYPKIFLDAKSSLNSLGKHYFKLALSQGNKKDSLISFSEKHLTENKKFLQALRNPTLSQEDSQTTSPLIKKFQGKNSKLVTNYICFAHFFDLSPATLEKDPQFVKAFHALASLKNEKRQSYALLHLINIYTNTSLKKSWDTILKNAPKASGKKKNLYYNLSLPFASLHNKAPLCDQDRVSTNLENIYKSNLLNSVPKVEAFLKSLEKLLAIKNKEPAILDYLESLFNHPKEKNSLWRQLTLFLHLNRAGLQEEALSCRTEEESYSLLMGNFPSHELSISQKQEQIFSKIFRPSEQHNAFCSYIQKIKSSDTIEEKEKERLLQDAQQFFQAVLNDSFKTQCYFSTHLDRAFARRPDLEEIWKSPIHEQLKSNYSLSSIEDTKELILQLRKLDLPPCYSLMGGAHKLVQIKNGDGSVHANKVLSLAWGNALNEPVIILTPPLEERKDPSSTLLKKWAKKLQIASIQESQETNFLYPAPLSFNSEDQDLIQDSTYKSIGYTPNIPTPALTDIIKITSSLKNISENIIEDKVATLNHKERDAVCQLALAYLPLSQSIKILKALRVPDPLSFIRWSPRLFSDTRDLISTVSNNFPKEKIWHLDIWIKYIYNQFKVEKYEYRVPLPTDSTALKQYALALATPGHNCKKIMLEKLDLDALLWMAYSSPQSFFKRHLKATSEQNPGLIYALISCVNPKGSSLISRWRKREQLSQDSKNNLCLLNYTINGHDKHASPPTSRSNTAAPIASLLITLQPPNIHKKFQKSALYSNLMWLIYDSSYDPKYLMHLPTKEAILSFDSFEESAEAFHEFLKNHYNSPLCSRNVVFSLIVRYLQQRPQETLKAISTINDLDPLHLYTLGLICNPKDFAIIGDKIKELSLEQRVCLAYFHGKKVQTTGPDYCALLDLFKIDNPVCRHILLLEHCKRFNNAKAFSYENIDLKNSHSLLPILPHLLPMQNGITVLQEWLNNGLDVQKNPLLLWSISKHFNELDSKNIFSRKSMYWPTNLKIEWLTARAKGRSIIATEDPLTRSKRTRDFILKHDIYRKNSPFSAEHYSDLSGRFELIDSSDQQLKLLGKDILSADFFSAYQCSKVVTVSKDVTANIDQAIINTIAPNPLSYLSSLSSFKFSPELHKEIASGIIENHPHEAIAHFKKLNLDKEQVHELGRQAVKSNWQPTSISNYALNFMNRKPKDYETAFVSSLNEEQQKALHQNAKSIKKLVTYQKITPIPSDTLAPHLARFIQMKPEKAKKRLQHFDLNSIPFQEAVSLFALCYRKIASYSNENYRSHVEKFASDNTLLPYFYSHQFALNAHLKCYHLKHKDYRDNLYTLNNQTEFDLENDFKWPLQSPFIQNLIKQAKNTSDTHKQSAILKYANAYSALCSIWSVEPKELEADSDFLKALETILSLRGPAYRNFCLGVLIEPFASKNQERIDYWKRTLALCKSQNKNTQKAHILISIALSGVFKEKEISETSIRKISSNKIFQDSENINLILDCCKEMAVLPGLNSLKKQWIMSLENSEGFFKEQLEIFLRISSYEYTEKALHIQSRKDATKLLTSTVAIKNKELKELLSSNRFLETFGRFRNPLAIQSYLTNLQSKASSRKCIKDTVSFTEKFMLSVLKGTFQKERYKTVHLNHIFKERPELKSPWMQSRTWKQADLKASSFSLKENWSLVETDSPEDLLLCGTDVSGSCMNINSNMIYNSGLMSYIMDGKHRLIAIKNAQGKIVARCILHLLWDKDENNGALFLQKPYGSSDYRDHLIYAAQEKAKMMNLPLYSKIYHSNFKSCSGPVIQSLGGPAPFEYNDQAGSAEGSVYTISRMNKYQN